MFGPTNEIQARLYRLLDEYRDSQDLDVLYAFGLGMYLHEDTEQALLDSPAITGVSTGWEEGGSRYLEIYRPWRECSTLQNEGESPELEY